MLKSQKGLIRLLCIIIVLLFFFLIGFLLLSKLDPSRHEQERDTRESTVGKLRTMSWQGETLVERTGITTLLVIGTDVTENTQRISARSGGQADFLMLLVLDSKNHEVRQLPIDRDTVTSVQVRGILGELVNRADLQICLSHGYGRTDEECNENTVDAVSTMFLGLPIDGYMTMNLGDVQRLNAALGGVTVTLEDDDLAELDPVMHKGATLKLTDKRAELMVHSRMTVGDGLNTSRMRRQAIYLEGAVKQLRMKISDTTSAEAFYLKLEPYFQTNMARGQIINLASRAVKWTIVAPDHLAGEHSVNAQGFMEFHVQAGEVERWLAENCFEPQ